MMEFRENLMKDSGTTTSQYDLNLSSRLNVPRVHTALTTRNVLVTEFVNGTPIGNVAGLDQQQRDEVSDVLLKLCLAGKEVGWSFESILIEFLTHGSYHF